MVLYIGTVTFKVCFEVKITKLHQLKFIRANNFYKQLLITCDFIFDQPPLYKQLGFGKHQ